MIDTEQGNLKAMRQTLEWLLDDDDKEYLVQDVPTDIVEAIQDHIMKTVQSLTPIVKETPKIPTTPKTPTNQLKSVGSFPSTGEQTGIAGILIGTLTIISLLAYCFYQSCKKHA